MGPPAQVRALKGPGTRESSRSSSNETEQEVRVFLPDTRPQVALTLTGFRMKRRSQEQRTFKQKKQLMKLK